MERHYVRDFRKLVVYSFGFRTHVLHCPIAIIANYHQGSKINIDNGQPKRSWNSEEDCR